MLAVTMTPRAPDIIQHLNQWYAFGGTVSRLHVLAQANLIACYASILYRRCANQDHQPRFNPNLPVRGDSKNQVACHTSYKRCLIHTSRAHDYVELISLRCLCKYLRKGNPRTQLLMIVEVNDPELENL
jgi:hypothetical protein